MKYVIDYFKEFACSLLGKNYALEYPDVVDGIQYYIKEQQLDDYQRSDIVSKRELIRFRGITPSEFIAFFTKYEMRAKLESYRRECSELALARLYTGLTISEEQCRKKLNEYYTLATDLATDPKYSTWLSKLGTGVSADLKFAANISNEISEEVVQLYRSSNGLK